MIWFWPYRFIFSATGDSPIKRLENELNKKQWSNIRSDIVDPKVKLWLPMPAGIYNSWNPVFEGRVFTAESGRVLKGYFRPNWFVLAFTVAFIAMACISLISSIYQAENFHWYAVDWNRSRVGFDIVFLAAVLGITILGWGLGLIHQNKMLKLLREISDGT